MRIKWMSSNILGDEIRNECIHNKLEVTLIEDKMSVNQLK